MVAATIRSARDVELERRVVNFLISRQVPGLRNVIVEAAEGTVTLRGRVRTFHEKQLCQNGCLRVAGVLRLVDCLDVLPNDPATQAQS